MSGESLLYIRRIRILSTCELDRVQTSSTQDQFLLVNQTIASVLNLLPDLRGTCGKHAGMLTRSIQWPCRNVNFTILPKVNSTFLKDTTKIIRSRPTVLYRSFLIEYDCFARLFMYHYGCVDLRTVTVTFNYDLCILSAACQR